MTTACLWDDYGPAQKDFLILTFNEVRGQTVPLDMRWGQNWNHRINDLRDFEFVLGNYSDEAELRKGLMSQKDACFEACIILRERAGLPEIKI